MSATVLHCSAFLFVSLLAFPNSKTLISALCCLWWISCDVPQGKHRNQQSRIQRSEWFWRKQEAKILPQSQEGFCVTVVYCWVWKGGFLLFPEINGNSPLMCFNLDLPHLGCWVSDTDGRENLLQHRVSSPVTNYVKDYQSEICL